jgi:hypothetical protein
VRIGVVAGGALGVWEEWERAVEIVVQAGAEPVCIAVNDAGVVHPDPLHHWASVHPDHFTDGAHAWEAKRRASGRRCDYVRWGESARHENVDRRVRSPHMQGGSSGLLAGDVALAGLGLPGVIFAGVGLDARPNPYNPQWQDGWADHMKFRAAWDRMPKATRPRMRSMSGWTRDFLGAPTVEWIQGLS